MFDRPSSGAQTVSRRLGEARISMTGRAANAVWAVIHPLGAHRWQEGYETDLERGWSRYRGSRCAVCDSPWEGW